MMDLILFSNTIYIVKQFLYSLGHAIINIVHIRKLYK